MDNEKHEQAGRGRSIGFWIALIRGVFAIVLGLILIFNPDKTRVMLFNFMGFFWLTSGIILLRRSHVVFGEQTYSYLGKKTSIALGVGAILAGLLVVSRSITSQWVDEFIYIELLGAVIILTGLLHLLGEARIGRAAKLKRTSAQIILALFEIVLGAMLIFSPLEQGPIIYWAATIWALVGGGMIISDAVYKRTQANRERTIQENSSDMEEG